MSPRERVIRGLLAAGVIALAMCVYVFILQPVKPVSAPPTPATTEATPPAAPQPAPPPATTPPPAEKHAPTVTATLKAVSLSDAKPLAGMVPIITLEPNAFDAPLAHGAPTDANGVTKFVFPADHKVCLRVWDTKLDYFPNNYFDVMAGEEDSATEGTIAMARAASLHALLVRPDNTPAADETVHMMMFHPKRGPWWPAEAKTDSGGVVSFNKVPPGMFTVQMECPSGRMRAENVTLLPGEAGDLGPITLAPAQ